MSERSELIKGIAHIYQGILKDGLLLRCERSEYLKVSTGIHRRNDVMHIRAKR